MTREVIQQVPLDKLVSEDNFRSRLNEELVEQIVKSFATVGQLIPIRVRRTSEKVVVAPDKLVIVDGHHRHAAAIKAKLVALAAIIEEKDLSDGEVLQRQLIVNCQREDVNPVDKARGIEKLMAASKWTAAEVAQHLGMSPAWVSRLLKLLAAPTEVVALVESGKIGPTAAYEIAQVPDASKQTELARQFAEGKLTRDGLSGAREAATRRSTPVPEAGEPQLDRATAILGDKRSVTVSCADLTLERFIAVIEELLSKARRERGRGTELSTFISLLKDQARAKPAG